jgi:hypothetical protein
MAELTQEMLLSLFEYRDGNLFWRYARSNIKAGALAGYLRKRGYRDIGINGELYLAHRLIFLYHHGYLPVILDHIDGDPMNNDISNIREATPKENNWNRKKGKSFKGKPTQSEYKGVTWDKQTKKWQAQIGIAEKNKRLGRFNSETEAAEAYNTAATKYFGDYACLNIIPQPL